MSRLSPAALMVSHPNTIKPGTGQFQRPNSYHCWTLINFWWVSLPSYGSKCSPPHDSDLEAPKTALCLPSSQANQGRLAHSQHPKNLSSHNSFKLQMSMFSQQLQWKAWHPSKTCSTGIIHAWVSPITFSTGSPEHPEHFSALELHLICSCCSEGLWMSSQRQHLALSRKEAR